MAAPINVKIERADSKKMEHLTKSMINVIRLTSVLFYYLVEIKDTLMQK